MSYKLAVLLVQNFHGMSLSLYLLGCDFNPVNDMDMANSFWINRSDMKRKTADHRPSIKTGSDFSIRSLSLF